MTITTFKLVAATVILGGTLTFPAFAGGVTPERLANADAEPQNWLMVHQNYSSHRYSQLDQINTGNVKDLRLAFAVPLGGGEPGANVGSLEGTPLVNDGFMYVTDPWGTPYKIDVRSGIAGRIMWVADTGINKEVGPLVTNRGLGLWNDLVITVLLDGRVVAVDDETGDVVWERQVADEQGEGFTNSPQIVGDKIIVANYFRANKSFLEIRVNDGSSLRGRRAHFDGPGADFFFTSRKVGLQPQELVTGANNLVQAGLVHTHIVEKLQALVLFEFYYL